MVDVLGPDSVVTDGGTLTSETGVKATTAPAVVTGGGALTSETGIKGASSLSVLWGGGELTSPGVKGPPIVPPKPVPPQAAPALPNPTTPPRLTASAGGTLPAGTYRYAYAGWRLSEVLVTAPSPVAEVTLAAGQGTVTVAYDDVPGATGHLLYRQGPNDTRLKRVEV